MLERFQAGRLRQLLERFPAVGLVGPRQVGKTTLARSLVGDGGEAIYLDLERPSDAAKLGEPELYLTQARGRLVILDEVQRRPDLFPVLRSLIDDAPERAGQFLLLGSAAPDLIRDASESLAGRIRYLELTPLFLGEVPKTDVDTLWLRGGFPRSYLARAEDESSDWREGMIRTYLEQDLPQLGVRVPALQLHRFWTMLAHGHAQLWNASKLAGSLGLSAPTIRRYLDLLTDTFVTRQLAPYAANTKKRTIKSPKVYLRDSGLLHALLGLPTMEALLGSPVAGSSYEGFVIEQLVRRLPESWQFSFYRTGAGAELDLVLTPPGSRRPIALEIKRTLAPRLGRGGHEALDDVGAERAFILTPGNERYPLSPRAEVVPVNTLPDFAQELETSAAP